VRKIYALPREMLRKTGRKAGGRAFTKSPTIAVPAKMMAIPPRVASRCGESNLSTDSIPRQNASNNYTIVGPKKFLATRKYLDCQENPLHFSDNSSPVRTAVLFLGLFSIALTILRSFLTGSHGSGILSHHLSWIQFMP
jgi:hypothetical protein